MHPAPLRFGPFVIDPVAYRLTKGSTSLELAPKAFDLLLLLARQPGRLVTKDDILAALWPDVAVTDNALTQVVSDVRQTLGDSPAQPKFIETVPRRGYRFVAEVYNKPLVVAGFEPLDILASVAMLLTQLREGR